MYLHGQFATQTGQNVTVHIVTGGDRSIEIEIGAASSGVLWDADPVQIDSSVNDTFDVLLRNGATINLLTRGHIAELFGRSCLDVVVNIFVGDRCVFAGYIEPQVYSQPYNEAYDSLSLNCIDALSALQKLKYRNITTGAGYNTALASADTVTFGSVLTGTLDMVAGALALSPDKTPRYLFDGSRVVSEDRNDPLSLFEQIDISELLFIGEDETAVWSCDDVVSEVCRYLGLHVAQDGLDFYIFGASAWTQQAPAEWTDIRTGETVAATADTVILGMHNVSGTNAQLSLTEVYNRIEIACDVVETSALVESPLDESDLSSPFTNRQKYMTEMWADGNSAYAAEALWQMVHDQTDEVTRRGSHLVDWFIQVKANKRWKFGCREVPDFIEYFCDFDNRNQEMLPNGLAGLLGASIVAMGCAEYEPNDTSDNSPVNKVDMTDIVFLSVNGNGDTTRELSRPNDADLQAAAPVAVYHGGVSGGVLSPASDSVTNYIVLSGSVVLNPRAQLSQSYTWLRNNGSSYVDWLKFGLSTVASHEGEGGAGRYYTQKYWAAETPASTPFWYSGINIGLQPYSDKGPQGCEYTYGAPGEGDTVSKIDVVACMLIIGNKCVVEKSHTGRPDDFVWQTYKSREECADDDEYYEQCFYIGIDPKTGDKLIGNEFQIQNNIDYTLGIDATGMAIPVRRSDGVSGSVQFMILGPVNTIWGQVTRRHKTWFRSEKWSVNDVPLLSQMSNIQLRSFEVKVYSDNGQVNTLDGDELVYVTDTDETFTNVKDDIKFRIVSALTPEESLELGVADTPGLSTPIDTVTGTGLLTIRDRATATEGKPEQIYADNCYREYRSPRIVLTQEVRDPQTTIGLMDRFKHPALPDKTFFIMGMGRNLISGTAQLKLKETWS